MGRNDMAVESRRKQKEGRLVIVAECYSKGWSYRAIRDEVMKRLSLSTYSLQTVGRDIDSLLAEWRKERIEDTDLAVTLLLERNRQHYQEAREEWDRSRKDRTRTDTKRKGIPVKEKGSPGSQPTEKIKTVEQEEKRITELGEGDPRYMDLMIKLEDQRSKLLGVYIEKHSVFGPNGEPLLPNGAGAMDIEKLTEEEKLKLLELARKIE